MRGDVKRSPWIAYAVVLVLILLVAAAPIISVMISSAIAEAHGCTLNEGGAHPCIISGVDRGEELLTMFVLGWLMLITLPAGAITCGMWAIVLLVHRTKWNRKRRMAATEPAGISGPRLRA